MFFCPLCIGFYFQFVPTFRFFLIAKTMSYALPNDSGVGADLGYSAKKVAKRPRYSWFLKITKVHSQIT